MIHGIHHVAMATPNADVLLAFYTGLMGFEVVASGRWEQGTRSLDAMTGLQDSAADYHVLQLGSSYLELFRYRNPETRAAEEPRPVSKQGITHFCLQVTDIEAEYERLLAGGMQFHAPPEPYVEGMRHRAVYGRDPDGNVIELLEIVMQPHPFGKRI